MQTKMSEQSTNLTNTQSQSPSSHDEAQMTSDQPSAEQSATQANAIPETEAPSYTKLAMRNMVRKSGKSLQHFFLSTIGLLALFIGLSYLTH